MEFNGFILYTAKDKIRLVVTEVSFYPAITSSPTCVQAYDITQWWLRAYYRSSPAREILVTQNGGSIG